MEREKTEVYLVRNPAFQGYDFYWMRRIMGSGQLMTIVEGASNGQ